MAENEIPLDIVVKATDALNDLQKFSTQATQQLKKVTDSTTSISQSLNFMKTAAIAAIGVFSVNKIVDFFESSIESAAESEKALNNLVIALQSTGEASQDVVADFVDYANELQKTTTISDDAALSQLAIAKSLGLTNDQAKDLVDAAADLSAVFGISLDTAVEQLGKTYQGFSGRLGQVVPNLKNLTAEQLRNGDAVKLVLSQYGDAAEGQLRTFSGGLAQLANTWDNLKEAVGNIIVQNPAVIASINFLSQVLDQLAGSLEDNQQVFTDFVANGIEGIVNAAPAVIASVAAIAKSINFLVNTVQNARGGIKILAQNLANFFGRYDEAAQLNQEIEAIALSVDKNNQAFESFDATMTDIGAESIKFADRLKTLDKTSGSFGKKLEQSGKQSKIVIQQNAEEIRKLTEDFQKFSKEISASNFDDFEKALQKEVDTLAKLEEFRAKGVVSAQQYADLRIEIENQYNDTVGKLQEEQTKKAIEEEQKYFDDLRKNIDEISREPIKVLINAEPVAGALDDIRKQIPDTVKDIIAQGVGILEKLLQGKKGAVDIISSSLGAVADKIIPGIGGAVASVIQSLALGPEAAKSFVSEFIRAVPEIIENIVLSIPAVVDALVETLIVKGGIFKIAFAFVNGVIRAIPQLISVISNGISNSLKNIPGEITKGFTNGINSLKNAFKLFKFPSLPKFSWPSLPTFSWPKLPTFKFPGIPKPQWVQDLQDFFSGVIDFFNQFDPTKSGGVVGDFIKDPLGTTKKVVTDVVTNPGKVIKDLNPFASGGLVPKGFPNDSFPAALTSGEMVMPAKTTDELFKLISNLSTNKQNQNGDQMITINLQVGEAQLSKVLVNMNKHGYRTS